MPQGSRAKKSAVACPINWSYSLTKLGRISPNGLGGDSIKSQYPQALLEEREDNNKIVNSADNNKKKNIDQLVVICTTRSERRLFGIWCQKECVECQLVISCRMMHIWIKIYRTDAQQSLVHQKRVLHMSVVKQC